MKAFGITGAPKWAALFASHPPLEKRIERLERA
jgi:Zn-dependent protease with chaperone function